MEPQYLSQDQAQGPGPSTNGTSHLSETVFFVCIFGLSWGGIEGLATGASLRFETHPAIYALLQYLVYLESTPST